MVARVWRVAVVSLARVGTRWRLDDIVWTVERRWRGRGGFDVLTLTNVDGVRIAMGARTVETWEFVP